MAGFGSLSPDVPADEAAAVQAAAEAAAERQRRAVVPPAGRREGAITRGLEGLGHAPLSILGAAAGLVNAQMDASGEAFPLQSGRLDNGGSMTISTDDDPRRRAAALNAETGLNLIGDPGLAAPVGGAALGSGLLRTKGLPMDEASRMQRAADQGFSLPLYHKTNMEGIARLEHKKNNQTNNYVLFDDKLIDILRKYALPGAVGAGGFGSLAPRGGDE